MAYQFDQWMHVKIVFAGKRADIYVDSDEPLVQVRELKRPIQRGQVGLTSANFSASWFANFEATPLPDDYELALLSNVEQC